VIRPDDETLTPSQLANVKKHADRLIREAGAHGVFPTPVARLVAAAKLTIVEDEFLDETMLRRFLREATARGVATLKSALSKVLGLFDPHDRLVMIDRDVPIAKKPFVKLHEAGHGFLPHQAGLFALIHDCEKTLDPDTTDLFEREANVFAVEALFQGPTFADEAHSESFGIKVPIRLAKKFGASNYSTFRRYVATNPAACCVIVLEPVANWHHGTFDVRRIVPSRTFDTMYDCAGLFSVLNSRHPIAHVIPIGRRMTAERKIVLVDRNNDRRECRAEGFNTTHQIFILIRDLGLTNRPSILMPSSDFVAIATKL
jgi:Zn-dependent peptidase ImmA (M78 family)